MGKLLLAPVATCSEESILEFRQEFIDAGSVMHGGQGLIRAESVEVWIEESSMGGANRMFFTVDSSNTDRLLGIIRITLELSVDAIVNGAFNIGYSVRPSERCKGIGTEQLKLAMEVCKRCNINRILIARNMDNEASRQVIIRNGGKLLWRMPDNDVEDGDSPLLEVYIIDC